MKNISASLINIFFSTPGFNPCIPASLWEFSTGETQTHKPVGIGTEVQTVASQLNQEKLCFGDFFEFGEIKTFKCKI